MFADRENLYVSDIMKSLKKDKSKIRKLNQIDPRKLKRYNIFTPTTKYELLRKGNFTFKHRDELDEMDLDEKMLFYFKHQDPFVGRDNKHECRYVAVFKVEESYVVPHQVHFKKIYAKTGRNDIFKADEFLEDGTPYWADLYRMRLLKEHKDKKKYRKKKRKT